MRRTVWRVGRTLLGLAISLELVWLLAANTALRLHTFPKLIARHTNHLKLDYARAWSLYPGDLHVRGFWISNAGRAGLEWFASADRADAQVGLFALMTRTFKTSSLKADGVAFRFRKRLSVPELAEKRDELPLWPQIRGFDPVPNAQLGPDPEFSDVRGYSFWDVDLEGAELQHVRDVWAFAFRLDADARIRGRLMISPHTHVELGPFELQIARGALHVGNAVVAQGLEVKLGGGLQGYDPRETKDGAVLKRLVASVDGRGELADLGPLQQLYDLPARGQGPFELHAIVREGTPQPGTSLALQLRDSELQAGPLTFTGPLRARAEVLRDAGLNLRAQLAPARVKLGRAEVHGPSISGALRLDADHQPVDVAIHARGLRADDLRPFSPFLPEAVGIHRGSARIDASLAHGRGGLRVQTGPLELSLAKQPLKGRFLGHLHVRAARPHTLSADLAGSHFRLDLENGWWFDARVPKGDLKLRPQPVAQADVDARAPNARPILDALKRSGAVPGAVTGLFQMRDLHLLGQGRYAQKTLTLAPLTAKGGHGEFQAALQLGKKLEGALLVRAGPASVGLDIRDGRVSLATLAPGGWFKSRLAELSPQAAKPARAVARPAARPVRPRAAGSPAAPRSAR